MILESLIIITLTISLSHANTDVRNLEEENRILRRNVKEYQKSLDQCQIESLSVPEVKVNKSPKSKKIKKKTISGPGKFIHVSGAKMQDCKMTIIDNTGMLDPRVRKFLHLAGIDPDTLLRKLSEIFFFRDLFVSLFQDKL